MVSIFSFFNCPGHVLPVGHTPDTLDQIIFKIASSKGPKYLDLENNSGRRGEVGMLFCQSLFTEEAVK